MVLWFLVFATLRKHSSHIWRPPVLAYHLVTVLYKSNNEKKITVSLCCASAVHSSQWRLQTYTFCFQSWCSGKSHLSDIWFREWMHGKLHYTYSILIRRIRWKTCFGILLFEITYQLHRRVLTIKIISISVWSLLWFAQNDKRMWSESGGYLRSHEIALTQGELSHFGMSVKPCLQEGVQRFKSFTCPSFQLRQNLMQIVAKATFFYSCPSIKKQRITTPCWVCCRMLSQCILFLHNCNRSCIWYFGDCHLN